MNLESVHAVFIALHALTGVTSFISGSAIVFLRRYPFERRLFFLYLSSLVAMVAFLASAMIAWWAVYTSIEQAVFTALLALGIYMLYRAFSALHLLQTQRDRLDRDYIHHIGFTLISLFEGFIIVSLINSRITGWIVALVAILGIVVGRWTIDMADDRVGV